MATDLPRPAYYALAPGGWRDWLTLLHPPYTAWHLSYVVVGAALAPDLSVTTLVATLAAFFLAVGIGAHALDELNDRPLRTRLSGSVLVVLAVAGVAGAVGIGIVGALVLDPWIGVFVAGGLFLVCAYNLELAAGRFHSDAWFALGWGAFPVVTAYFAQTGTIRAAAVLGAVYATAMSAAQRHLSTQVRDIRRRVVSVHGRLVRVGGEPEPVTRETLIAPAERALRSMVIACWGIAAALLIIRVT